VEEDIGESVHEYFCDVLAPAVQLKLSAVLPFAATVIERISGKGVTAHLYGSGNL
jgi:hypothetical protein